MKNEDNANQWHFFNAAVFIAIAYLSFFHEGFVWWSSVHMPAYFDFFALQTFFAYIFIYLGFTALVSFCSFWSIMSSGQKNIPNIIIALILPVIGFNLLHSYGLSDFFSTVAALSFFDIPYMFNIFYPFIFAALLYGSSSDAKDRIILKSGGAPIKSVARKNSLMINFSTTAKAKGGKRIIKGKMTMNMGESVKICFQKYADFNGRASRSELWWFTLFHLLAILFSIFISSAIGNPSLYGITWFALFIPGLAAMVRRLHDTNKSGWNYCWSFTVIGAIPVLIWLCQKGDKGKNRF